MLFFCCCSQRKSKSTIGRSHFLFSETPDTELCAIHREVKSENEKLQREIQRLQELLNARDEEEDSPAEEVGTPEAENEDSGPEEVAVNDLDDGAD